MGETIAMKMAKPSKEDFDAVWKFMQGLEWIIEYGCDPETEADLEHDDQEAIAEWVEKKWESVSCSWQRLIMAGQVAIDNACRPDADTLEWKPEIAAALEKAGVQP